MHCTVLILWGKDCPLPCLHSQLILLTYLNPMCPVMYPRRPGPRDPKWLSPLNKELQCRQEHGQGCTITLIWDNLESWIISRSDMRYYTGNITFLLFRIYLFWHNNQEWYIIGQTDDPTAPKTMQGDSLSMQSVS